MLLKSLLIVLKKIDPNSFIPSITHFAIPLLKKDKGLTLPTKKLVLQLLLRIGQNESTVGPP